MVQNWDRMDGAGFSEAEMACTGLDNSGEGMIGQKIGRGRIWTE